VIPTIFSRPALLPLAVESISNQSHQVELVVGCPEELAAKVSSVLPGVRVVSEPKGGSLAQKINYLFAQLDSPCDYIGWLGDDDLLLPDSIQTAVKALDQNLDAVMVYGGCDYVDPSGGLIGTNRSSQFASKLLHFGPQLIPQPGSLWRREAFEKIGGLSSDFNLAFDFDLFLRLSREGKLLYVNKTLAQFRWHPDSLSVRRRWVSASEASKVRRRHYSGVMRFMWLIWEPLVMVATWLGGKLLSLKVKQASS
jgi:GT2 family glycosyltransferase